MYIERGCQYKKADLLEMYRYDFWERSCMVIPITFSCGVILSSWGIIKFISVFFWLGAVIGIAAIIAKIVLEVNIRKKIPFKDPYICGSVIFDDDSLTQISQYGKVKMNFSELYGYLDRGSCMYLYKTKDEFYCLTREAVMHDWDEIVATVASHCDELNRYPDIVKYFFYLILSVFSGVAALCPFLSFLTVFPF